MRAEDVMRQPLNVLTEAQRMAGYQGKVEPAHEQKDADQRGGGPRAPAQQRTAARCAAFSSPMLKPARGTDRAHAPIVNPATHAQGS